MARTEKLVPTERDEQIVLAQWLDLKKLLWCAVPNGGHRNIITAARMRAEGTKAGVPDILIFSPPNAQARGTALEMKRTRGGRLSECQCYWLDQLRALNWHVIVAYGADDAIEQLMKAGY